MPDRRRHRGPAPQDATLFAASVLPRLREACADYCWLLDRGYAEKSALELVGNRHQLVSRQRQALFRSSCSRELAESAESRRAGGAEGLLIDGYNVLVSVEAALSGGLVLDCRDGVFRDLASVHGSYRRIEETVTAIDAIHAELPGLGVRRFRWLLDRPVGNSGRLAVLLRERMTALPAALAGEVEVVDDPDALLSRTSAAAASADRVVLARASCWVSLARAVIRARVPDAWVLRLAPPVSS